MAYPDTLPEELEITVVGFKKWNPRKDVQHPTWFRLSHKVIKGSQFYDFSFAEKWFMIWIFAESSEKNEETFTLHRNFAKNVGKFREKDILSALQKLERLQIIKVKQVSEERNVDVTDTYRVRASTGRKEGRNNRNNRNNRKGVALEVQNVPPTDPDQLVFSEHSTPPNGESDPPIEPDISPPLKRTKTGIEFSPVSELVTLRRKLHLEVHGVEPIEGRQVNGILAGIVKEVGREEAPKVLAYFYRVPNNFYRQTGHDLKVLRKDLPKLITEARRGFPIMPDDRARGLKTALNNEARTQEILRRAKEGTL